jgi:hypothetical protein
MKMKEKEKKEMESIKLTPEVLEPFSWTDFDEFCRIWYHAKNYVPHSGFTLRRDVNQGIWENFEIYLQCFCSRLSWLL